MIPHPRHAHILCEQIFATTRADPLTMHPGGVRARAFGPALGDTIDALETADAPLFDSVEQVRGHAGSGASP